MTSFEPTTISRANRLFVAGVQMPVPLSGDNVPAMIAQIEKTVALYPGVEMIVMSELAARGPLLAGTVSDASPIEAAFRDMARKHGIWLAPGSLFVRRGGQVFNTAVVISPGGAVVGRYEKMFPFRPFEAGVAAGTDFLVFDIPDVGRLGLSICYDIWFPETTRTLTSAGVEVLIHPVLTGTTDRTAEIAIVQATAAMFQCFVVDVNGLEAGGIGRSLVADPAGRVIHQAGQALEIFPIDLDLALVRRVRAEGANGLGQVLKSYRDRSVDFTTYGGAASAYLQSLGPLQPMKRRSY